MKKTLLLVCGLFQLAAFGQQNFQIPLDYVFATQGIDGPNNYANGGTVPSAYDGTSTLNWFSTPNSAFQLQNGQYCSFAGNAAFQPTENFSLVIRIKIDLDDVQTITDDGKAYTIWMNGPQGLFITSDGNGGYLLLGSVKNGTGMGGHQNASLSSIGLLENAIMGGWVTFYLVYEQNTTTNESKLNVSFNGVGGNDNSATTVSQGINDLVYDNPTNDFYIGANPNDPDLAFDGMIDYCYFYNYRLSLAQRDQFDATVCEKLTGGTTTLTPREPYDANLTYDWCAVTNAGSGDVFTSTGISTYSFTPSTSGTYMCKIGFGGLYTTYTEYRVMTVSDVGLNELAKDEIQIYPNPASASIMIENTLNANIRILDLAGKQAMAIENNSELQLNVAELTNGIYIVQFVKDGKISTGRFVKQ